MLVRVAKLGPSAHGLVLAAAALGTRCALADAVALAAVPDPLVGLDEAVKAGLLTEVLSDTGHDVAFTHELVRAAVYADLSPARRHALHRAAAAKLDGDVALQHRIAAAVGPDTELATELATRGRADLDGQRWRQAADRLVAAAELSDVPAERSARLAAAVGAMITDGDLGRALRYEADLRASGQVSVLGRLEAMTGRIAAARETLTAALALSDDAAATAHLALVALVEGDAAAAAERAREALTNDPPSEVVGLARFVRIVGLVAAGRHADARAELAGPADAEAGALTGLVTLWADDPAGAAAILASLVRDGASPTTSVRARVLLLAHLAEAHYRLGDWDAAATNGGLAVSLARDAGVLLGTGMANALASYVASSRGDWETARARVTAATAAAAALPWWGARLHAASAQAVLAQARGDHAAMEKALRAYTDPAARGSVDRLGLLPWRTLQVEALLGLHRVAEAEEALAALEERSPVWSAVDAARLRCAITEIRAPERARAAYADAMAVAERVPAALARARLETAYGRHLLESGDRRGAIDLLRTRLRTARTPPRRALPRPVRRAVARRGPAPARGGRRARAHHAGAGRGPPRRRGPHQPGDGHGTVRHQPHGGVPPQQHLREAGRLVPPRAGRAPGRLNGGAVHGQRASTPPPPSGGRGASGPAAIPACMTTQTQQEITVKSGKGASQAWCPSSPRFFGVLPGHEAEIGRRAPGTVPSSATAPSTGRSAGRSCHWRGGRRRRMLDG